MDVDKLKERGGDLLTIWFLVCVIVESMSLLLALPALIPILMLL